MAREFGKINLSIWQDRDWRKLPPPAQHLYLTLWTHPTLTYCGVVDWRPGRLTALAEGWSSADVQEAADCLEARLFIVVDRDTEEALIRSYVRFDGLMKQPRVAVSFANAYAATASNDIRGVVIHEAIKLRELEPTLGGWEKPQVQEMLKLAVCDPRSRTLPDDPFGDGFPHRFGGSFGHSPDETESKVSGLVSGSPTTATTTATSLRLHTPRKTTTISSTDVDGASDFDVFWDAYGKKVGRGDAEKAFTKARKKTDATTLIHAAGEHASWHERANTEPRFIPHASKWLNSERWSDERPAPVNPASKPSTTDQRVRDGLALAQRLAQDENTHPQQRAIGHNA